VEKFSAYRNKTDLDTVFKLRGDPDGRFNAEFTAIFG
jgi:hypothetical protein